MARSSLMRLVRTLAARTRPGPSTPEEAVRREDRRQRAARNAEQRERRRELLRRGLAVTAVGALAPATGARAAIAAGRQRVVVVGGGLAGLSAAWQLAQQGIEASLVEGAPRVGGRCWTERRAFDGGQIAERGGELVDTAHDDIIDLALVLGLSLDDLYAATPKGTESVYWIGARRYGEDEAARDFAMLWPALERDSRRLGDELPTFAKFTREQALLDRTSARQWLDSRVPGGLASPLGRLLGNAYTEELGGDLDEISAVTVIDLLRDSPRDRVSPYEESDQRYHVRGGNDAIVTRLAEPLSRIETGTRLVALARRADGRYRLTLARDGALRDVDADHVVLALPFPLLAEVDLARAGFRARKLRAIRELGMGRNTKLQLQFADRAWIAQRGNGETRTEGSYHVSWEVSRAQGGTPGILNFYTGGALASKTGEGTPEERAKEALADLERVHPGIAARWNGRVIRNAWDRHPWSRGSYSLVRPGQYTAFRGIEGLPEANVHFAGEQSSADWYGYLNGAVESGLRAARDVTRAIRARRAA